MKRIFKGEIEVTTVTSAAVVNVAVVVIVYAAVTLFPWSSMLSVYLETRAKSHSIQVYNSDITIATCGIYFESSEAALRYTIHRASGVLRIDN